MSGEYDYGFSLGWVSGALVAWITATLYAFFGLHWLLYAVMVLFTLVYGAVRVRRDIRKAKGEA